MKTITFKANDMDQGRIQDLKEFYAECWNIDPEEISTSDIIRWSLGMLHGCKVEQNFRWISTADLELGEWQEDIYNKITG